MLEGTVLEGVLHQLGEYRAVLHLLSNPDIPAPIRRDVNDLHSIEAPPALTDNNELEDNNDGVDDSRVFELHVELSKKSRKCLPYFYVTSLY